MRLPVPLALAAVAALVLAGCATGDEPGDSPGTPGPAEAGFPVTVGELTLAAQPTRIVSLSPAVTEMLFAIGAGDQVVAVDEFSNYPPEAPVTELSGFTVNAEAVAAYEPDLVVISSYAEEVTAQLGELSIPVHVAPDDPVTVDDVYTQITDLGALAGRTGEAADLVERMSGDLSKLAADAPERAEPLTYYLEIDETLWTYTSGSLVGSLFAMVGLENIAEEPGAVTMQLSPEAVVGANPDLIFLANTAYGMDAETVAAREGWSGIAAVQTGQIVELDTDIASRWGPRIVDLMEAVVDAVSQVP
jgi:iron complex transport system substrate-binding protein